MNEHEYRLEAMLAPGQQTWDLSDKDVAAIRWALARIAELEAERAKLNREIAGQPIIGCFVERDVLHLFSDATTLMQLRDKLAVHPDKVHWINRTVHHATLAPSPEPQP